MKNIWPDSTPTGSIGKLDRIHGFRFATPAAIIVWTPTGSGEKRPRYDERYL